MKSFLSNLFEYHHKLNKNLIEVFHNQQEKITPAMHRLFCHMLNAHQIWNSRIKQSPPFQVFQLHDPATYTQIDQTNMSSSLDILHTFELTQQIRYSDSRGESFENAIQDILFHITNHHTHHRGQLMKMLREEGLTPLVTDYIYHTRTPIT